tara:strand:- start:7229 stop:9151 length:1923 start_codon:yes stop_codon:yes gene_type:complete
MRIILIAILVGFSAIAGAQSQPPTPPEWQTSAQSIVAALDYVAIDYPEAVQAGAVVNAVEYAEQREFLTTVNELLFTLPPKTERQDLLSQAQALASLINRRAPSDKVASGSRRLVANLIEAYDVVTAPIFVPAPGSVASLYAEQCSVCHGDSGRGDGLAGFALDPSPTNFHDVGRARQRSLYGLYSTLTLGVTGTGMPSFSSLTENQRWSLAFYVAGLRDDQDAIALGKGLWDDNAWRDTLPSLANFTSRTPAEMEANMELPSPVLAYLRRHPEALTDSSGDPIQRTIAGLRDVVSAYRSGKADTASQLALSAYLEGYELIEAPLRMLDDQLAVGIEKDLLVLRNMIRDGVPEDDLASSAAGLEMRLQEAAEILSSSGSSTATLFASAFLILLREGLEAIVLLAAMSLYLKRTEHPSAMQYLHFGWIGALTAGALTWIGIKTVIDISGAQRELIEGVAALLAAIVLLYVGIWLHRHSHAAHWRAFLSERLGKSLSGGTLWGVAALAFIAVYREILETVLFYEALWLQSQNASPLIAGGSLAALALAAAGWVVFRLGARLPLRLFFRANGVLMFVLAVIFAGKGVAALQEAGMIGVTFVGVPRIDWLGIYPTVQGVSAQLAIVGVGALSLAFLSRRETAAL